MVTRILFIFIALGVLSAHANDSAVETAVGGLHLRKEHRILMQKENLYISEDNVVVEYEFANNTENTVTSEVAFPIPIIEYVFDDIRRDFQYFKAWVDGKPIDVKKEVRAYVGGFEITDVLRKANITIETFGNFDPTEESNEIIRLDTETRNMLVKIGALEDIGRSDGVSEFWPAWKADIKYHWTQQFHPHSVVKIKHEYRPVVGYTPVPLEKFKDEFKDACLDDNSFNKIRKLVEKTMERDPYSGGYFGAAWVGYILTTANSWQTPIKDFNLIVKGQKGGIVTFCWDGTIEKIDEVTYKVHKQDFIPDKDLRIYFLKNF